ncbi:integrase [Streptomyces sp. NPDC002537]
MPYVEWRGNKCRVKWWAGEYLANGKKKWESESGFTDEETAMNYGLDQEYEVRHGIHIKTSAGDTLMKHYCWDWYDAQDLRFHSLRTYKSMLKRWIVKQWGEHAVADITAFEYQAWKKSLKALATEGKLSSTYVDTILMVFGMLMNDAVDPYHLRKVSPVPREAKRRGKYTKKVREKKRPLEISVVHALARNAYAVWGYTGWTYIWTIAFTGMRPPGEMFGLRRIYASPTWPRSEPDLERRDEAMVRYEKMHALRVQHQHQWINGKKTLTDPKYDSHRTLVIPPFLHEMHSALLESHNSPWVFPSMKGSCLLGAKFHRDYWYPMRDGAKARTGRRDRERPEIPAVKSMAGKRIYLLRHGHKEWLEEDGHPEVAMEARMGHEIAGVRGLYGNLTPGMELRITETLQERWEHFVGQDGGVWMPPIPSPLPVDHSLAA